MSDRELIIQLNGEDIDGGFSALLAYQMDGGVEFVATEERDADATVVLSSEQVRNLVRELAIALDAEKGDNAS